jgi:pyruvate,water dikinase
MRELLPDLPSELFLSLLERVDWRECYRRLGTEMPAGTLVRAIEGRPYFNLSLIGAMMAKFGLSYDRFARWIGHGEEVAEAAGPAARPFRALLLHPAAHLRAFVRQRRMPAEARWFFDRVHARTRQLSAEDPAAATDARILEACRELEASSRDFIYFLMAGFNRVTSKMLALELLLPRRASGARLVNAVVPAGEKNISVRQGLDLLRLAQLSRREGRTLQYLLEGKDDFRGYEKELEGTSFLPAFQDYLRRYGHRGIQETDPAMPLYRDAPGFLLKAIGAAGEDPRSPDPETLARRQEETAARAWRDLRRDLSLAERLVPVRSLLLRGAVRDLKEAIALRERIRFEGMRVAAELRRFLREAGRRLRARDLLGDSTDLFLLRLEEIEAVLSGRADGAQFPDIIRRRREERSRREAIPMPNLLRESEIGNLAARRPLDPAGRGTFQGLPVGPGRIEGRVVVLEGPHQVDRVRRGDILVAPALDPSWIPLFTLASGLVVEMGGTLSHGSIIAREYGLPTVVNLPGITRALKSGDRILLDGSTGLVRRLET